MEHIPLLREMIAVYTESATAERIRSERPSARTVENVLVGLRAVCRVLAGDSGWLDWPVTALTRRQIDRFLSQARAHGLSSVTAWGYVQSLKGLTARWTLGYYADRGWRVAPFDLPPGRRRAPRYVRPDRALLLRVRAWYEGLGLRRDPRDWLAATLMLEFAMRNGDVAALRWGAFRRREGPPPAVVLCYTPHKTALSSGRMVAWPVHPDIWRRLDRIRAQCGGVPEVVPHAAGVFARLNAELRGQGLFTGAKALYELRKICIDHVYQRFGAEMASSISGDDIRTVTRYYADPSAVSVAGVRVVDLL